MACDDDNGSGAGNGKSCTVSHTETTLTVHQTDGINTYDVSGVLAFSGRINNSYREYYASSTDAQEQCAAIKAENWFDNIVCSGNTITYTDYNEMTIEEEAADYQEMCDSY